MENSTETRTEPYPGYIALIQYLRSATNPKLGDFVKRNKAKVAGWSGVHNDCDGLKATWVSRFQKKSNDIEPGIIPDIQCPELLWKEVFAMTQTAVEHNVASMSVMQESARTNVAQLRQAVNTMNAEASSDNYEMPNGANSVSTVDSWSSADAHPKATYLVSFELSTVKDILPSENERWHHNGVDMSQALNNFRHKSVQDAIKLTKALSPRRTLALSYVYLFALSEDESAFPFKSASMRFNRLFDREQLGSNADEWCRAAREALEKNVDADPEDQSNEEEWSLASILANNLLTATALKNKQLLSFAEVLYDLATTDTQWAGDLTEDTHVHAHIAPLMKAVFTKDKRFTCQWANTMLEALRVRSTSTESAIMNGPNMDRLLPDFTCSVKVQNRTFDLLALEVKPPKKTGHDLEKLGRELKVMFDALIKAHIPEPIVCGIHVQELTVRTYKMELTHDGIYQFLELQNVDLITKHSQLGQLPAVFETIWQTKNIVARTAQRVKSRILQKMAGDDEIPEGAVPMKWMRPDLKKKDRKVKRKAPYTGKGNDPAAETKKGRKR
ncbi:hypothetical protein BJV82DRAFT_709321 [Fennellomyces sp. T-0311]|nr:hypothetical protein BJV82DRAFT_709321 [Fennellomyces sp. T-0311]